MEHGYPHMFGRKCPVHMLVSTQLPVILIQGSFALVVLNLTHLLQAK